MAANTGGPCAPSQACWSPASPACGEPAQSSLTHGMSLVRERAGAKTGGSGASALRLPALGSATGLLGQSLLSGRPPSPAGLMSVSQALSLCPLLSSVAQPCFLCCCFQAPVSCSPLPSFSVHVCIPVLLLWPGPLALSQCVWGARNRVCWAPGACEWGLGGLSVWAWAVAGWEASPCCFCSTAACCALQPQNSPPASPHCTSPNSQRSPRHPQPCCIWMSASLPWPGLSLLL